MCVCDKEEKKVKSNRLEIWLCGEKSMPEILFPHFIKRLALISKITPTTNSRSKKKKDNKYVKDTAVKVKMKEKADP